MEHVTFLVVDLTILLYPPCIHHSRIGKSCQYILLQLTKSPITNLICNNHMNASFSNVETHLISSKSEMLSNTMNTVFRCYFGYIAQKCLRLKLSAHKIHRLLTDTALRARMIDSISFSTHSHTLTWSDTMELLIKHLTILIGNAKIMRNYGLLWTIHICMCYFCPQRIDMLKKHTNNRITSIFPRSNTSHKMPRFHVGAEESARNHLNYSL